MGGLSPAGAETRLGSGETWVHINVSLNDSDCYGDAYGEEGTVTCDRGRFENVPGPDPNVGPWPYTGDRVGTARSVREPGKEEVSLYLYVPQSQILGRVPSRNSDRYSVYQADIDNRWHFTSAPHADPSVKAGDKGGPLSLKVTRHCTAGPDGTYCRYQFEASGWVVTGGASHEPGQGG